MYNIDALTGTLYGKLPMEMVGNIYSYCNPVIEATNDIVNSREFEVASDKIRLKKFVVAIIERMNEYYRTNLSMDDVDTYYIEDDNSNENDDEKLLGVGHNMELYFKAEAIERERTGIIYNELPNTRKYVVFVDNWTTHRELFRDYYEDKYSHISANMIRDFFGEESFGMSNYIFKKVVLTFSDDIENLNEFIRSIVAMLLRNDTRTETDFLWESLGEDDDYKYNAGIYYGIDDESIVRMDYCTDGEDDIPEYYIVPYEYDD